MANEAIIMMVLPIVDCSFHGITLYRVRILITK